MEFQHNQPEYSVSEISARIKRTVEDNFGYVRVRGEISKASVNAASGHCYLTLKDDKSVLDAICWKGTMAKLAHKPQAGLEVIATGKLTTYPGRSSYQLVIDALEPAGVGALMAMLEQRKRALEKEGLFDAVRKKPIPFLPESIGIITSPTGAVIRDMLHRLRDRFPRHVLLWPVAVQGQGAAEQIAAAVRGFNAMAEAKPDVLIVARGGGSIEDLWAFNEEVVVRAVAASVIPVISAVGHETDTTLIDYAADKRAPTPTGAAEFAVPVREELRSWIEVMDTRQKSALRKQLLHANERVLGLARGLPRPQQLVAGMAQSLDSLSERLAGSLTRGLGLKRQQLHNLMRHLSPRYILLQSDRQQQALDALHARAQAAMQRRIERQGDRLERLSSLLASLNVLTIMQRGFALVKDAQGKVVGSAAALAAGQAVTLQFHDGQKGAMVDGTKPPKPRKSTPPPPGQGGLFD
jgi:exodeoxyribonuclease VII large subunit